MGEHYCEQGDLVIMGSVPYTYTEAREFIVYVDKYGEPLDEPYWSSKDFTINTQLPYAKCPVCGRYWRSDGWGFTIECDERGTDV